VRFAALGDVMVDVVCSELPPPNTRTHADVWMRAGGSAVNAAAAAVAVGAPSTVLGRIGSDPPGDLVAAGLAELGIGAHLARDPELPTGMTVALGPDASSVIANRGANARLSPEDIPDVVEADALFVSGFALFQKGSADAARTALERYAGPWVGVDVGSPRLAEAAGELELVGRGERRTVLLATADEARAMTGEESGEAARRLALRWSVACVKLGEDGAAAASGSQLELRRVDRVVRRSPFGAGDAFGAVLLVELAGGAPIGRALELACAAGARAASTRP
jgi:ribokinase